MQALSQRWSLQKQRMISLICHSANTRVNTSRFDVGGKRNNATGLDAFVYAERDIYRPGEKLNYSLLFGIKHGRLRMKFRLI